MNVSYIYDKLFYILEREVNDIKPKCEDFTLPERKLNEMQNSSVKDYSKIDE